MHKPNGLSLPIQSKDMKEDKHDTEAREEKRNETLEKMGRFILG